MGASMGTEMAQGLDDRVSSRSMDCTGSVLAGAPLGMGGLALGGGAGGAGGAAAVLPQGLREQQAAVLGWCTQPSSNRPGGGDRSPNSSNNNHNTLNSHSSGEGSRQGRWVVRQSSGDEVVELRTVESHEALGRMEPPAAAARAVQGQGGTRTQEGGGCSTANAGIEARAATTAATAASATTATTANIAGLSWLPESGAIPSLPGYPEGFFSAMDCSPDSVASVCADRPCSPNVCGSGWSLQDAFASACRTRDSVDPDDSEGEEAPSVRRCPRRTEDSPSRAPFFEGVLEEVHHYQENVEVVAEDGPLGTTKEKCEGSPAGSDAHTDCPPESLHSRRVSTRSSSDSSVHSLLHAHSRPQLSPMRAERDAVPGAAFPLPPPPPSPLASPQQAPAEERTEAVLGAGPVMASGGQQAREKQPGNLHSRETSSETNSALNLALQSPPTASTSRTPSPPPVSSVDATAALAGDAEPRKDADVRDAMVGKNPAPNLAKPLPERRFGGDPLALVDTKVEEATRSEGLSSQENTQRSPKMETVHGFSLFHISAFGPLDDDNNDLDGMEGQLGPTASVGSAMMGGTRSRRSTMSPSQSPSPPASPSGVRTIWSRRRTSTGSSAAGTGTTTPTAAAAAAAGGGGGGAGAGGGTTAGSSPLTPSAVPAASGSSPIATQNAVSSLLWREYQAQAAAAASGARGASPSAQSSQPQRQSQHPMSPTSSATNAPSPRAGQPGAVSQKKKRKGAKVVQVPPDDGKGLKNRGVGARRADELLRW